MSAFDHGEPDDGDLGGGADLRAWLQVVHLHRRQRPGDLRIGMDQAVPAAHRSAPSASGS